MSNANPKETIGTTIPQIPKPVRPRAGEKARTLLEQGTEEASQGNTEKRGDHETSLPASPVPVAPMYSKITTKVLTSQLQWMREQITEFQIEHPRSPKLTMEEVVQVAIDELRTSGNLDERIQRYRG